mmetsp:Transcript_5069/g.11007  ORF Transcript_5069/g.11007 Transcript_5069/m.11007 type:complete len:231 (-) Transcript_5069:64-756(-)
MRAHRPSYGSSPPPERARAAVSAAAMAREGYLNCDARLRGALPPGTNALSASAHAQAGGQAHIAHVLLFARRVCPARLLAPSKDAVEAHGRRGAQSIDARLRQRAARVCAADGCVRHRLAQCRRHAERCKGGRTPAACVEQPPRPAHWPRRRPRLGRRLRPPRAPAARVLPLGAACHRPRRPTRCHQQDFQHAQQQREDRHHRHQDQYRHHRQHQEQQAEPRYGHSLDCP